MPSRRSLVTIGDVGWGQSRIRRRTSSLRAVTMGQPQPNFVCPSPADLKANPASDNLSNAAYALQNYLDSQSGTPSIHTAIPQVGDFQTQWNADAISNAHGGASKLNEDANYGDASACALNLLTGVAPAANHGSTPSTPQPYGGGSPAPSPIGPPLPGPAPAPGPDGSWIGPAILVAAIVGGLYLLFGRKKKGGGSHHHHGHTVLEVKRNPRRRSRGRLL